MSNKCRFLILIIFCVTLGSKGQGKNKDYHFDGKISEEVLRHYLSRAITMAEVCTGPAYKVDGQDNCRVDDIRFIKNTGAKFVGRAIFRWGSEKLFLEPEFLSYAVNVINQVHAFDDEVVFQAAVFEIVTKQVNDIPVPEYVFKAFDLPVEKRNFNYRAMLFPSGRYKDLWGGGSSVPDITQSETKLWFYYLASSYIDAGIEAIHWGQVSLMGKNDPKLQHWFKMLAMIRQYALENARRGFVINDAHAPDGGFKRENELLMDFHSFPLRIKELEGELMKGILEIGQLDAIYGKSMGGKTASGWSCEHLPYLVEFDNFGVSDHPGKANVKDPFIWGYDDISWFSLKGIEAQEEWLEYAYTWLKLNDNDGYIQMPACRVVTDGKNPKYKYKANIKSDTCPTGTGLETKIKELWSGVNNLSWEELSKQYKVPEWFTSARFGVWVHWGAQSVPESGGGWYARHMYMTDVGKETWGENAYNYHNKTYGHPSEKGFKDVIHEWKAENLDTDKLLNYFKNDLGARYFMALAHHHDNFDNWNSTHHEWNTVNVGPKRDIIGEFSKSAKKYDIPFGVSTHDERFFEWMLPAFSADKTGEFKGVPYDGRMTIEDGKGTWWEGLDPATLYGLSPEKRTPEWAELWKYNWMLRMKELLTTYDVDFMWFDGWGFPFGKYGKEAFRTFYNHSLNTHGKINAVIAGKIPDESAVLQDIERGVESKILAHSWQSISTFADWFYKKDQAPRHNSRSIIELLIDVVSKNGNYVLNVELLPDGTIPSDHKVILDGFGDWLKLNGEAIYDSKPWKVHGDNFFSHLTSERGKAAVTDLEALKKKEEKADLQFNNRDKNSIPYRHDEVRFTTKDDVLYVILLNPTKGAIELSSLGLKSKFNTGKIESIELIGSNKEIKYQQTDDKLILNVPAKRPNNYASVFKIKGICHNSGN